MTGITRGSEETALHAKCLDGIEHAGGQNRANRSTKIERKGGDQCGLLLNPLHPVEVRVNC
jgi:hypothetical protein